MTPATLRQAKGKATKGKAAKKAKPIGTVIHYYDKIGVGVIKLKGSLKVGDTIKLQRGDQEFTQTIESIQVNHENIEKAKKGDDVGIKLNEKIKEGATVTKE